jgi:hypothetical protein
MPLAAIALVQLAWSRPPLAAPKTDIWTPDRLRAFVLKVEREMSDLSTVEGDVKLPHLDGTCWGMSPDLGIKTSVVFSRLDNYLEGRAEACYVLTYLGCRMGQWIARPAPNFPGPLRRPFNRSKVTIISQTADRVVADVTEVPPENEPDGIEPFTEAESAAVKDSSRYTITRGKGGVWRISDRKPSFPWVCENWRDEVPPNMAGL